MSRDAIDVRDGRLVDVALSSSVAVVLSSSAGLSCTVFGKRLLSVATFQRNAAV